MSTTNAELEEWMRVPREGVLEFKAARNQYDREKVYGYSVAIANEGGGKLILGVSDSLPRQVVGSNAFRNIGKITQQLFTKLPFQVDVEELPHPDGRVVIFHIPARPIGTPYELDGKFLIRVGESLVPMSSDRLRQILDEGKPDWFSEEAKNECSSDDVIQLLDVQSYFDLTKTSLPTTRDAILDRFEQESLILRKGEFWAITNLGAILFAKNLEHFVSTSRKAPRVIVYPGVDKTDTARIDEFKKKGYAAGFESLIDFINGQIPTNPTILKILRDEKKMFPEIAIREVIANALIHQDLTETGMFVMVELYSDRLEISNPGAPAIPPERFIDGYKARNERLADLMRRMGICEERGSGIDKVIRWVEVYQLPAPVFRDGQQDTQVILFSHKEFEDMDRSDRIRACYQHCCLRYVMTKGMTNQSLRKRFDLDKNQTHAVSRIIAATVQEGRIKLADTGTTSTRYTKYIPSWA